LTTNALKPFATTASVRQSNQKLPCDLSSGGFSSAASGFWDFGQTGENKILKSPRQCELGKWLRGEGQKYTKSPEFAKLFADHTHFHKAAGEVARKADSGQQVTLGSHSEFATASAALVKSLMAMKSKL